MTICPAASAAGRIHEFAVGDSPSLVRDSHAACETVSGRLNGGEMARARQAVTTDPLVPPGVDPAMPSPARLYDYYLGGTVNYASARKVAERLRELIPELADTAWANRAFHQRAARWMAAERGIRQFIDIGSGQPPSMTRVIAALVSTF